MVTSMSLLAWASVKLRAVVKVPNARKPCVALLTLSLITLLGSPRAQSLSLASMPPWMSITLPPLPK